LLLDVQALPPSPPAEKATTRQDQARQTGTSYWTWHRSRCDVVEIRPGKFGKISTIGDPTPRTKRHGARDGVVKGAGK
jgi:hypothetical protein